MATNRLHLDYPVERRTMPHLAFYRAQIAGQRGQTQAAIFARHVQDRYDALYARRTRYVNRILRWHLEERILPGLALYQTFLAEGLSKPAARDAVRDLLAAFVRASRLFRLMRLMKRWLPRRLHYPLLRRAVRWQMKLAHPPAGWSVVYVEDSPQRIAFDIRRCLYLDTLRVHGAVELTSAFCDVDDVLFAELPAAVVWERTHTLGRGDDRCDFCFRRA